MIVLQIREDKMQSLTDNVGKALKYMGKAMSCIEEMSQGGEYNERNMGYHSGGVSPYYNERSMGYPDDERMREERMRYYNERNHMGGYGRYR